MTEITFRSDCRVTYIDSMGDDKRIAQAARVSTAGLDNDREKYVGLVRALIRDGHWSPLESCTMTIAFDVPAFTRDQIIRHRSMSYCISGDTEITFMTNSRAGTVPHQAKTIRKKTIAEHWEHWHYGVLDSLGRRRKLPNIFGATVMSYDEETGARAASKVEDICQSGVKPVYRMTTALGKSVKATLDHKFLTTAGWKVLGDIAPGDQVMAHYRGYKEDGDRRAVPAFLRDAINNWTSMQREEIFNRDGHRCGECGKTKEAIELVCDHRVPVVADLELALSKSNLRPLCLDCDVTKSSSENAYRTLVSKDDRMFARGDEVVSIEFAGEEMTYDIQLEGPHHNFFGNGIVTHNSVFSLRYSEAKPAFWVPSDDRPLVQVGKALDYRREQGSKVQRILTEGKIVDAAARAWLDYERMIESGIANEVARTVLPNSIYSPFWATGNLRSWLHFIGLRNDEHAQYEVREAAAKVEEIIGERWPVALAAYRDN